MGKHINNLHIKNIMREAVLPVEQHKVCPSHPGEILKELYIDGLNMSVCSFCLEHRLSLIYIERLIKGNISCSIEFAKLLSEATNTTPELWLNLQANYDKWMEANGG